jgi:hypothetical protein
MPRPGPVALLLLLGLLGCGSPRDPALAPSERARAGPPPRLAETAMFESALSRAAPDAARIETEAAELAARAEALAARAAALSGPVPENGAN